MARFKLDVKNKRVVLYITLEKVVRASYKIESLQAADLNEDSMATLMEGMMCLFETGLSKTTTEYYYRRRSIQKRSHSKPYRMARALRKLRGGRRKRA
jgi:hypothetical protein